MTVVSDLQPSSLWRYFDEILTIPRGSKEEGRIRDWVVGIADRLGLEHEVDATGNVVVRKPASPGRERAPATVLQAHLDMVNEKNSDVDFDFATDAIRPVLDGAYLTADGTTLGSDNGIGVAAMLAVMAADDLEHGPLEFLFTVDEETGLTGARGLDPSLLQGRRLINLDSEEEGTLTVGCAGGADTKIVLPLDSVAAPSGSTAHTVKLFGLNGGHSGIDIHLQRGNAVQLLARILRASELPGHLARIEGGDKHNAIPREARATLVLPAKTAEDAAERLTARFAEVRAEFSGPEPGMRIQFDDAPAPASVWSEETGARVLDLLVALPHGVVAMSNDIPGLVETSSNLAAVRCGDTGLQILTSSRSSVASGMDWIRGRIEAVATLAGASVDHRDGYPGWKPDMDSPLLEVVRAVHERVLGAEPHVVAVHAGLECGIIGEMVPGMDMISFGPQIEFPHSPGERVKVDSVGRFYRLLTATLEELAR
ncbi:MAG TPA: aminoacyl-histidine dipeptidase [Longimicrobiales bacterium]|nr:aminoacyl-histidine dipeptidase [Longimicrobiales bacterium]